MKVNSLDNVFNSIILTFYYPFTNLYKVYKAGGIV